MFWLADILDKEKFNVELIVQCIRISKMPQTHHHALLLLGAVAGMFPVSRTWNLCVISSGFKYWEEWRTYRPILKENLSERTRRQNVQVPCSFRTFYFILVEKKNSVLLLCSLVTYDLQWTALEMEEAFWQQPAPYLLAVVKVLVHGFIFPLLFYIQERKHLPQ